MATERVILCGEVAETGLPVEDPSPLRLRLWGPKENVHLKVADISERMLSNVPARFRDLLEIATYVYSADQAVRRGGDGVENVGAEWRRHLFFRLPVRDPDFWSSRPVRDELARTLGFLSEDEYSFEFLPLAQGPPSENYLFTLAQLPAQEIDEVVLFSGGLDSLGGAVQEGIVDHRRLALVTHMPTPKLLPRHRKLEGMLADRCAHRPFHVRVKINKEKGLGREYTQRTRSFLYASIGATVARMLGLSRIRFYENGVVSFNLPPSPQIVGAKATRTTHPQVLKGFERLLSALAGVPFAVENPFLWKTKTEVGELIRAQGCAELVKFSTSCTHTWEMTALWTHCGKCSQCIDRRFATLAAGLGEDDPAEMYHFDLITGERDEGEARTMLAAYLETANEVARMSPVEFFARFGEASRALRHLGMAPDAAGAKLFDLHRRHAAQVNGVVDRAVAENAPKIRERRLPPTCLVRMLFSDNDAATPSVPAAGSPGGPASAENAFYWRSKAWEARFAGGRSFIVLPSKGAAYLHLLLANRGRSFKVGELATLVAASAGKLSLASEGRQLDPEELALVSSQNAAGGERASRRRGRRALAGAYEASDDDAMDAYRARAMELQEELDEATEEADRERIREQMSALADRVKKDRGLGGRSRPLDDPRERLRKAVGNAIRRVIQEIAAEDRAFAEHLASPRNLQCGLNPCYDPREPIHWQT